MTRKIVLEKQNQRGSVSIVSLLFLERQGRVVIFLKRFGKTDLEHVFQYFLLKASKMKKESDSEAANGKTTKKREEDEEKRKKETMKFRKHVSKRGW